MNPIPEIERELDERLEAMGFELVDSEWAGSRNRPRLRLRVDYPASEPGLGVTVNDCARVSRTLESWLDESPDISERYVLEVSSPGVERPLVRRRDFVRFTGKEVDLKLEKAIGPEHSGRLQGVLLGVEDEDEGNERDGTERDGGRYDVLVELADGSIVRVPRRNVRKAKLVFRWKREG